MHKTRIARGARFMDREFPGWETRIDVQLLDPDNPTDCALGQGTGNFEEYMARRYLADAWRNGSDPRWYEVPSIIVGGAFMARYGFCTIRETNDQWRVAWATEINKRLAGGRPMGKTERFRRRWFKDQVAPDQIAQEWTMVVAPTGGRDEENTELVT